MTVSRRSFIGGPAALVAAPAIVKVASLMPVRSISPEPEGMFILPPRGNTYLSINEITREAVRLFQETNLFLNKIDRQYDELHRTGERREGIVVIRRRVLLPNPQADNRRQVA